jgi:hypothetical protein
MPRKWDNIVQFVKENESMNMPYFIVYDFEAMLKPIQTCTPSDKASYTTQKQSHVPISCVAIVVVANPKLVLPPELMMFAYFGEDVARKFLEWGVKVNLFIKKNYYSKIVPMIPLTKEQKEKAETGEGKCNICETYMREPPPSILTRKIELHRKAIAYYERFQGPQDAEKTKEFNDHTRDLKKLLDNFECNMAPVCDHEHLTGEFRGVAHNICNLNYKLPKFVPIFAHNMSGYDAHLFVKELGSDDSDIKVIANTEEKYTSFSKMVIHDTGVINEKGKPVFKYIEMRFLDSFRFMAKSLDALAKNLEPSEFKELRKHSGKRLSFSD